MSCDDNTGGCRDTSQISERGTGDVSGDLLPDPGDFPRLRVPWSSDDPNSSPPDIAGVLGTHDDLLNAYAAAREMVQWLLDRGYVLPNAPIERELHAIAERHGLHAEQGEAGAELADEGGTG